MISMMSFIIIVLLILQLAVSYQSLYNIKNHKYNNYIQYANRETITSSLAATTTNPKDIGRGSSNELFISSAIINSNNNNDNKLVELNLPTLSRRDLQQLQIGERVEKQNRDGRSGNGLVVLDVKASVEDIFEVLASFDRYEKIIPTVRSSNIYSSTQDMTVAEFSLSRFRLKVNVVNRVYPEKRLIKFSLDPSRPNLVLRQADGFWYVEKLADRPGYSRVWLSASVVASRLIPTVIVDYAAKRALPRASSWLQPYFANIPYSRDDDC